MAHNVPPITPQGGFSQGLPKEILPTIKGFALPEHSSHGITHQESTIQGLQQIARADSTFAKLLEAGDNPIVKMNASLGTKDPTVFMQVLRVFKKLQ